jgi:hypothetical protein
MKYSTKTCPRQSPRSDEEPIACRRLCVTAGRQVGNDPPPSAAHRRRPSRRSSSQRKGQVAAGHLSIEMGHRPRLRLGGGTGTRPGRQFVRQREVGEVLTGVIKRVDAVVRIVPAGRRRTGGGDAAGSHGGCHSRAEQSVRECAPDGLARVKVEDGGACQGLANQQARHGPDARFSRVASRTAESSTIELVAGFVMVLICCTSHSRSNGANEAVPMPYCIIRPGNEQSGRNLCL